MTRKPNVLLYNFVFFLIKMEYPLIPFHLATPSSPDPTMSLPTIAHSACTASQILSPVIFGAEILNINANLVQNYSAYVHEYYYMNHADVNVTNVSFCNVTVTYTHPGQNDTINAEIWLPTDTWNGRMMGVGGSGWISGRSFLPYQEMTGAIGEGYMAMTNDAGLGTASDPLKWGMVSPGNVNMYLLQDLASVSLNDTAYIAKQVSNSLYGQPPNYSYWSGCSQGGRQGMMLAQKYPDAYDGIVASAPAINWAEFITADFWPQLVMNSLGQYPRNCETAAIVAAAIAACDPLDGLTDNVISDPDACNFDPFSMVNSTINCTDTGTTIQISSAAATVVNATWAGVHSQDGSFLWYGPMKGADLTGGVDTIADTSCTSNGTCVSSPNALVSQWIQVFLKRQLEFDVSKITAEDFDRLFHMSVRDFTSIVGTNDPDLSDFRARGGKLLSYHGLVSFFFFGLKNPHT